MSRKIRNFIVINLIFTVVCLGQGAIALQKKGSETYTLEVNRNGESFKQQMIVEEKPSETIVRFYDDKGESSINRFSHDHAAIDTRYINAEGEQYMAIVFDPANHSISSSGLVEENYDLEEHTFDGNGAMFYVFSHFLPEPGERFLFHVLQSKDERIVQMYLSYAGSEEITVNGKSVRAKKYENGLESSLLSIFWPYKYYYWYSEEDNRFLMYRGPADHENEEIITVISVK